MPRSRDDWSGAAALWITVAGWAGATRRLGFAPTIVTPNGVVSQADCLNATRSSTSASTATNRHRFRALEPVRQMARDARRALRMSQYRRHGARLLPQEVEPGPFVWQHHELFHRTGDQLASHSGLPVVEYVHAPIVWEGKQWGVRRPGWATILERVGERPSLRRAEIVACVSTEVCEQMRRLGVPSDRIAIAPMGVDVELFTPGASCAAWRAKLAPLGGFLIGWVGSFRRFHALELAIEAVCLLRAEGVPVGLVLIGDGQDRRRLEGLVAQRGAGDWVQFIGAVAHDRLPALLASLDAAIITARAGQQFHYSPLKLREYLAAGLPVVAPDLGEPARVLEPGVNGLLYHAGDTYGLASALGELAYDAEKRAAIGAAGRALVVDRYSWDAITRPILARLGIEQPDT